MGTFSTGLRQRLRLAMAFLSRPSLVLLDEPAANLDDAGRAVCRHFLLEARELSMVVVLATHVPDFFEEVDHWLCIEDYRA